MTYIEGKSYTILKASIQKKKGKNIFRLGSLNVEMLSKTEICKMVKNLQGKSHFPFSPLHAENISFSNIVVTRG